MICMTEEDWELLEEGVLDWMETLGYSTWGPGWDLTDTKERPEAAAWLVRQMRLFDEWVQGEIEVTIEGMLEGVEQRDFGVHTGREPFPTVVADPGLAERPGYLRRQPEQWSRNVEGDI